MDAGVREHLDQDQCATSLFGTLHAMYPVLQSMYLVQHQAADCVVDLALVAHVGHAPRMLCATIPAQDLSPAVRQAGLSQKVKRCRLVQGMGSIPEPHLLDGVRPD